MKKKAEEIVIGGLCRNLTQNLTTDHDLSGLLLHFNTVGGGLGSLRGEERRRRHWKGGEMTEIRTEPTPRSPNGVTYNTFIRGLTNKRDIKGNGSYNSYSSNGAAGFLSLLQMHRPWTVVKILIYCT
ncbi:hypothetical protein ACLB2K_007052 [Fragaria x ananassa]